MEGKELFLSLTKSVLVLGDAIELCILGFVLFGYFSLMLWG